MGLVYVQSARHAVFRLEWDDPSDHHLDIHSTLGPTFSALAWIPAEAAISGSVTDYFYRDHDVRAGQTYFYRLRQEDFDGQSTYSPIVSGNLPQRQGLSFRTLPNPGTDWLFLDIQTALELEEVSIKATDGLGRTYYDGSLPPDLRLPTGYWPTGMYFITLEVGEEQWQEKWIKVR